MRNDTYLFRHVKSEEFYHSGFVNSAVFVPRLKEDWLLSVYDGENMGAKESADRWLSLYPGTIVAVVAVTQEDCRDVKGYNLPILPSKKPEFEEHMEIDFRIIESTHRKSVVGKELRDRAAKYGFLWKDK